MNTTRPLLSTLLAASLVAASPAALAWSDDPVAPGETLYRDAHDADDFRRFGTLLSVGARNEYGARMAGAWSLHGTGAGLMIASAFMVDKGDDAVREAGWWSLGTGAVLIGFGALMMLIPGGLEDLHADWRRDTEGLDADARLAALSRYEGRLKETAASERTSRLIGGWVTTILSAGMTAWGIYDMASKDTITGSGVSLAVTGTFGLGLGLWSVTGGRSAAENLWEAWEEGTLLADRPGPSIAPGLSATQHSLVLGLGGVF